MRIGNFDVPGKNLRVFIRFPIERKDLSGQGSITVSAPAGNKGQRIDVACQIPVGQRDELGKLVAVAGALDDKGDLVVYSIVDKLANAMKIRRVYFDGDLRVAENETLRVYDVSFALAEYNSVAEKLEKNADAKNAPPVTEGEALIAGTPDEVNRQIKEALS